MIRKLLKFGIALFSVLSLDLASFYIKEAITYRTIFTCVQKKIMVTYIEARKLEARNDLPK